MRTQTAALLVMSLVAACDDGSSESVQLVGVTEGDYLAGVQSAGITVDTWRGVVRAELYLDGLRVAADELAPFELSFDTRSFTEGPHELEARAHLDDGSMLAGDLAVHFDNTPPALGTFAANAEDGKRYIVPASDNGKVARVEILRGRAGEAPIVVETSPFQFVWPWGCGPVSIEVRVVDAAGLEATGTAVVQSASLRDQDCDGYISSDEGGDDCNDFDRDIYPGAPEIPEGFDLSCDGVTSELPGFDSDGDGVASIGDGGDDCDDTDASIHGGFLALEHTPIVEDGEPVRWNPGEAAVASGWPWRLILNRAGVIQEVSPSGATLAFIPIATGANPGAVAATWDYLAYGQGNQVVVMVESGTGWFAFGNPIPAAGRVGFIGVTWTATGARVAFQAGTQVYFASSENQGATWKVELVADPAAPLTAAPLLSSSDSTALLAYRTTSSAWRAWRSEANQPFELENLLPAPAAVTGLTLNGLVAVDQGNGAALYYGTELVANLPRRVVGLHDRYNGYVYVQLDGAQMLVLRSDDGYRSSQDGVLGVGSFDTALSDTLAGDGVVHRPGEGNIEPAYDADQNDGVDTDCNRRD